MHEFPGYQLERELGRGAMAVVYLATQLSLKRQVALKVLDRSVDGYADMAQRFMHEAHTLAGLRHRNIVTVHDVVESAQGDFISMEYLDGGSLGERLALGLGLQQSLAILAQLGSALDVAHARGIVHRDIKPDNVLFRDDDTPVLTDFGIAHELAPDAQRLTQAGLVLGTPSYMAPEQISGDPLDGRADQYSLGAMFFQMLTGRVPYTADNTTNLLYAHMARAIPRLPDELAVLQPVLQRMLAKTPDERYPDMAAMLLDVSRHLLQAPELLRTPPGAVQVSPTERLHQLGLLTTGLHAALPAGATQALPSTRRTPKILRAAALSAVVIALAAMVYVFRADLHGVPVPLATTTAPAGQVAPSDKSIAVLPFVNMSTDKDQDYFADGISEDLLNLLAKIPQLQVTARTSSFSFKGKDVAIPDIARALHVAHVLEGSVRRAGNTVRITVQLVDAATGTQLWSQTYDRKLDDVFAIQDEIAADVVRQLQVKLLGAAPKARTTDPEAYALYLQAVQLGRQNTAEAFKQAEALLHKVLAIDPRYAPAWGQLASNLYNQAGQGLIPSKEGFAQAREAAMKALATDPDSAPAHGMLGIIAMTGDNDLAGAAQHLSHALALDPADLGVLGNSATLLANLGRLDETLALGEAVGRRDPVNATALNNLGTHQRSAGRFDQAIMSFRTALSFAPGRGGAHAQLGAALLLKGDAPGALAEIQQEPIEVWKMISLPMAYHALGRRTESDAALAALIAKYPQDAPYNIAHVYAYRGEPDQAFAWLDKAVEVGDPGISEIVTENLFDKIHTDPRWLPFLRKIGKAPEQLAKIKFDVPLPKAPATP